VAFDVGELRAKLGLEVTEFSAKLRDADKQIRDTFGGAVAKVSEFENALKLIGDNKAVGWAVDASKAVVDFAIKSTKAANEAAEAQFKLAKSIEMAGSSADAGSFDDLAEQMMRLTGVADETVLRAASLGFTFGMTEDQVKKLLPAVNDLSAKMGYDLEGSFQSVARAVSGNARGLQQLGIYLDEETRKTFEAMGATERFEFVLDSVANREGLRRADFRDHWRI
jgi:hypothetical protein